MYSLTSLFELGGWKHENTLFFGNKASLFLLANLSCNDNEYKGNNMTHINSLYPGAQTKDMNACQSIPNQAHKQFGEVSRWNNVHL